MEADRSRTLRGRSLLAVAMAGLLVALASGAAHPVQAQELSEALAQRLTEAQQRNYVFYLRARKSFDFELQAYWIAVDQKRDVRKKKRAAGQPFTADDYIAEQPPKYQGPPLDPEIAKIVAAVGKATGAVLRG